MREHVPEPAPRHREPRPQPAPAPVAELVLELEDLGLATTDGKHRAKATATLVYHPPEGSTEREVESRRFSFTAPLGPIETDELAWYLERYPRWPSGVFVERAKEIERKLVTWGCLLAEPLLAETARDPFEAWKRTPQDVVRRFSVLVDDDVPAAVGQAVMPRSA